MKQFSFVLILVVTGLLSFAQGSIQLPQRAYSSTTWQDTGIVNFLAKQQPFGGLSKYEQELFYWVNVLRRDPGSFWLREVETFLASFPEARTPASNALKTALLSTSPLQMLQVSAVLTRTSREHSDFLAGRQLISHVGRDGKDFSARMKDAGVTGCGGENIFEGHSNALVALILLLIDEGVPSAGHRKALLNPAFTSMGVGMTERGQRSYMVQQFGCR